MRARIARSCRCPALPTLVSGLSAGYDHDAGSVECSAKGLTGLDLLTAAREGDARAGARQTGRPYLLRSCRQAITLTSTLKPNQIA